MIKLNKIRVKKKILEAAIEDILCTEKCRYERQAFSLEKKMQVRKQPVALN